MKRRKTRHYSEEFKWRVVQEVISGRFTKEEARKYYGIQSNCAILYWMRQYSGIKDYRRGDLAMHELKLLQVMKEEDQYQKRIKELEEALEHERVRADLWQKMVEIAEEDYKIDIRKKSGAKQSTPSKNKRGSK